MEERGLQNMSIMAMVDQRLDTVSVEVLKSEELAMSIEVVDEEAKTVAMAALVSARKLYKAIESCRTEFTGPLNARVKEINGRFKMHSDIVAKADGILDRKIKTYLDKVEDARKAEEARLRRIQQEEDARIRREQESAQAEYAKNAAEGIDSVPPPPAVIAPPPPVSLPPVQKTVHTGNGALTSKSDWKHRVVDPKMVPREYWIIDEAKLRAVVRAGVREIPGVEIYQERTFSVRG